MTPGQQILTPTGPATYCGKLNQWQSWVKSNGKLRRIKTSDLTHTCGRKKMEVSDKIRIKLKRCIDPGEPEVDALVVERSGIKHAIRRVRVVGEHPYWRGAEFKRQDFTLVR